MPFYAVSANLSSGDHAASRHRQCADRGARELAVSRPAAALHRRGGPDAHRWQHRRSAAAASRCAASMPARMSSARATIAPFGKSPIPLSRPARPSAQSAELAAAHQGRRHERAAQLRDAARRRQQPERDRADAALGPLDMLLAAPIPDALDVLAWAEHSRLKDLSYQWALGELEKRAAAGDLPLDRRHSERVRPPCRRRRRISAQHIRPQLSLDRRGEQAARSGLDRRAAASRPRRATSCWPT